MKLGGDRSSSVILLTSVVSSLVSLTVWGGVSNQPYIDSVQKKFAEESESEHSEVLDHSDSYSPYMDSIKKKWGDNAPASQHLHSSEKSEKSYTERLKAMDPHLKDQSTESYTELEKVKLEPKAEGGAIDAVLRGKSDLEGKKIGTIHHAFGFRYGASLTRTFSGDPSVVKRSFQDVYGANYSPDLSIFYEFQPFHSEVYGNIGFMFMGGVGYYSGIGALAANIQKPGGGVFDTSTNTKFQFFTLPVTLAASYRFNLFKYLRPFALIGPSAIGYVEMRNDKAKGHRGHSEGFLASGGVSVLLDWMVPSSAWDLYSTYGIHHYYLTLEYSRLTTLTGELDLSIYGLMAGLTFEY